MILMNTKIVLKNISEADKNYNYKKNIEHKINNLTLNKNINNANKELIMRFLRGCLNEGLSNARIGFYVDKLKFIVEQVNKDLVKCTGEDIERLITAINLKYDNAETRRAYIVTIKKFYRHLTDNDNPDIISWLKIKNYTRNAKKRSEQDKIENVLTPQDVEQIINKADNPRDRALVSLLYYSAGRIGELIVLKIKDIEFNDFRTIISLNGKTGFRKVPVLECTKLLKDWLEYHPDKTNKEAYVWISFGDTNRINNLKQFKDTDKPAVKCNSNTHISVRYIEKKLKSLRDLTGITKKVNPHNFRHSRLTSLGLMNVDEDMLKLFAGHSKTSNVTSMYKHYSYENLSNEVDRINGIKPAIENKNTLNKCFRCEHLNRSTLDICEKCGYSLNIKNAGNLTKQKSKEIKMSKILGVMLKDEVFQKALARYMIDKNLFSYAKALADEEK